MHLDKILNNKRLSLLLLYLYVVIIIILTILPKASIPELEMEGEIGFRLDYPLHFITFVVFGVLLYWHWISFAKKPKLLQVILVLSIGLAFSIADEYFQLFIPDRKFNPVDIYSNVGGTILGYFISIFFFRKFQKGN